ncbi:4'-phosphopantetheinyl transferase superfamily protein [Chitinimonas viridis]|uniref:4'-phosphopantetheinyl transferase superfamily protein n=1 Tax=Chitinimonas viridis TaxID=664880 RepID=A0ABT8B388_9NEIS|nr:4'-phosphopantetheinyl transferase superfamily protein [Chitinimonas viridis]MDN3576312.1 4'-phosphopantetheinyl transferase superfamily protein [Chitinimonas viridis]
MSGSEQARLDAISAPRRRAQFLAGHYLARRLLSQAYGGQPADWQIDSQAGEAPSVVGHAGISISLSHSADWLLCAVADRPVGVDLELAKPGRDIAGMAAMVCHPVEQAALAGLAPAAALAQFTEYWTLKEAWLKCHGLGLDYALMRRLLAAPRPVGGNAASWHRPDLGLHVALVCAGGVGMDGLHVAGLDEGLVARSWLLSEG